MSVFSASASPCSSMTASKSCSAPPNRRFASTTHASASFSTSSCAAPACQCGFIAQPMQTTGKHQRANAEQCALFGGRVQAGSFFLACCLMSWNSALSDFILVIFSLCVLISFSYASCSFSVLHVPPPRRPRPVVSPRAAKTSEWQSCRVARKGGRQAAAQRSARAHRLHPRALPVLSRNSLGGTPPAPLCHAQLDLDLPSGVRHISICRASLRGALNDKTI